MKLFITFIVLWIFILVTAERNYWSDYYFAENNTIMKKPKNSEENVRKKRVQAISSDFLKLNASITGNPRYKTQAQCKIIGYSEGRYRVKVPGIGDGYADDSGEMVIAPEFFSAGEFNNGYAVVRKIVKVAENREIPRSFVIDLWGNILIGPYFTVQSYSEGFFAVSDETGFYYVDENGHDVFLKRFISAGDFKNGFAMVTELSRKKRLIDTDGRYMLPDIYTSMSLVSDHRAIVWMNSGGYGVYNTDGYFYTERFEMIKPFVNGAAEFKQDDLWGIVDTNLNRICLPMFNKNSKQGLSFNYVFRADENSAYQRRMMFLWRYGAW